MSDDFVVNDKRLFNKDGQVNPESKADADDRAPGPDISSGEPSLGGFQGTMPPANFTGLLIGLATSAFMQLGDNPEGEEVDLAAAKHAIDLLAVLQDKTRGNLEPEESSLLSTLLYDLRIKFVQASKKA